jgi:hypothetical protein
MQGSEEFYQQEVEARRKVIEDLTEDVKEAIVAGYLKSKLISERLSRHSSIASKMGNFDVKDFPNSGSATQKQLSAAMTAKKNCHRYAIFVKSAVDRANSDENLIDYAELLSSRMPDEIKYYITQARKCYYFEAYDACIVMIARAIEFALKEYLKTNKRNIPKPAVMGKLIAEYEVNVGKKDVLKYINEVQKMDRNIAAHYSDEERNRMGKAEADHSWTAIRIILRDLLNIDMKIRVEKTV